MAEQQETFIERLRRIEAERKSPTRRLARNARPLIVHADGVVTRGRGLDERLRFGFPLRGVIVGALVVLLVKAFLIWVLGPAQYDQIVGGLFEGSRFEQVAAHVLAADAWSL